MTDLSDPARPQILAVERGRDTAAALKKAQSTDPKKVADALSIVEFDNLWGKAHFGGKDYYGVGNQIIYPMPFSEVKDGVATLVTQLLPPHN